MDDLMIIKCLVGVGSSEGLQEAHQLDMAVLQVSEIPGVGYWGNKHLGNFLSP